ncbi:MAG: hypothetical protein AAGB11_06820 [Pseudomonadota bacterium]
MSPLALAQDASFDAETAVRAFLTDKALLGADTATVGSVVSDGNTVTASDIEMIWQAEIQVLDRTTTMNASAKIPNLSITGLAPDGDGHKASDITVESVDMAISMDGADVPISYDLSMSQYTVTDASWGAFPQIKADPAAPLSRFGPLLDWSVTQSFSSASVGKVTGSFTADGDRQDIEYGPMSVGAVRNGQFASIEYGPFSVEQDAEGPDGNSISMTVDYGRITGKDFDTRPLIALLTGNGAEAGPQTIVGEMRVDGVTFSSGGNVDGSLGPIEIENNTIDPSRGPLLEKFDGLAVAALAGTEPDPAQLASLMIDIYGAYGIDLYQFSDINITVPDGSFSLARALIRKINADGMERFAIEGVRGESPEGKLALGTFEITDLVFPERDAFMEVVMNSMTGADFDPTMLGSLPTMGGLAIVGLMAQEGSSSTPLNLDRFDISLSDYINGIPTKIGLLLEGLQIPAALLDDPQVTGILQAVGADPIRANGRIDLTWDEQTGAVTLNEGLSVEGVGEIETNAQLSGIPRVIFENPMRANEAVATAAVGGVSVRYQDGGLAPFLLGMMSEQAGIPADQFAAGMSQQVEMQLAGILGDQALAGSIAGEVQAFLSDPRNFSVSAQPPSPVPLAQLIGAAMAAPAQIPQLLQLSVSANQ